MAEYFPDKDWIQGYTKLTDVYTTIMSLLSSYHGDDVEEEYLQNRVMSWPKEHNRRTPPGGFQSDYWYFMC